MLEAAGVTADARALHPSPPVPDDARVEMVEVGGRSIGALSYSSGFQPPAGLRSTAAWASHPSNATCRASLLRHTGAGRPWLLCVHGYRMGMPWLDTRLFTPAWLHDQLGLNLLIPSLPLHGGRRAGRSSGDYYLDGHPLDLLLVQSQALWDLRRAVAWIRSTEPDAKIGVLGYSLGGFNAALLAAHEPGIDFVVAGIPLVDVAATLWSQLPTTFRRYFVHHGLTAERYRRLLQPVSPLALPPQPGLRHRAIFAGLADRVVGPEHALQLARHWDVQVNWYNGGHLSFRHETIVGDTILGAMRASDWPLGAG